MHLQQVNSRNGTVDCQKFSEEYRLHSTENSTNTFSHCRGFSPPEPDELESKDYWALGFEREMVSRLLVAILFMIQRARVPAAK